MCTCNEGWTGRGCDQVFGANVSLSYDDINSFHFIDDNNEKIDASNNELVVVHIGSC
jgi:hypothetical protein